MTQVPQPDKGPNVIVLGALSAIAEAAARVWAAEGAHLVLAAREAGPLEAVAADLRVRGATVATLVTDLVDVDAERTFDDMTKQFGRVDVILLAYGVLGDQQLAESHTEEVKKIIGTNFTSAVAWCMSAANLLERQRHGCLIVIGSVAGDRGRASNYIYGAAKGGLGILVQGIAHRLARSGARAVLVKPGFVDTPMTAAITKKGFLWSKPDEIALGIVNASKSSRNPIIYAPPFWRWIMYVVRFLPAWLFHKTKL
jgi:NAD(P)-dependent dehydrogenase (short-subunit alcohol dehydrogenase family)